MLNQHGPQSNNLQSLLSILTKRMPPKQQAIPRLQQRQTQRQNVIVYQEIFRYSKYLLSIFFAEATSNTTTYSNYDAALYSAATMYVAQQNNKANTAGLIFICKLFLFSRKYLQIDNF